MVLPYHSPPARELSHACVGLGSFDPSLFALLRNCFRGTTAPYVALSFGADPHLLDSARLNPSH